ncbi:nucleotidyltransferase family protein [Aquibium carbonis]|uniref:Nucleotidyltransferase family protein n=1 Tax=Aquibium carbonis TaxID=2495581 RepID=A0A3R9YIG7_9HYPH|nr:nucleotidyltransferase family protein [Aquibium carbonis]RST88443.1 nucleotidyltransferase family protein [Aquibium carbonis]
MSAVPETAMVLAAGLGTRMRPITDTIPKPLVEISGRTLLDRGLDTLERAGVRRAVVNVHHLADRIIAHVASRMSPAITISDETSGLLDSAGGIVMALPHLGADPFLVLNADTFWIDADGVHNLAEMARAWDPAAMDMLLLTADMADATGHTGGVDFTVDAQGRLARANAVAEGVIYAGAMILHPRIFEGAEPEPHSLNLYFDRAIAAGRLFGHCMRGVWITVGTPDAIPAAEAAVARAAAGRR